MLDVRAAVVSFAALLCGSVFAAVSSVYIADENPPPAELGESYRGGEGYRFLAYGNDGEVTWELKALDAGQTGLPEGMTLSADGVLSGVPVAKGVYSFTVGCSDSHSSDSRPVSLIVADFFYVSSLEGVDDVGYGRSPAMPFATVERAVAEAEDGSLVYVAPGVYGPIDCFDESIGEAGGFKSISFIAVEGPAETAIDGDGGMCCNIADDGLVEGFTIRGGGGEFGSIAGGTIRRCVITGCVYAEVETGENEWTLAPVAAICELDHCTVAGNLLSGEPVSLVSDDVVCEFTIFRGNSWAGDDLVDPRFVDPSLGDYRLLSDSPYAEDGVATWGAFATCAEYPPVYDPLSPCFAELRVWLVTKGLLDSVSADDATAAAAARSKPTGRTHEAWEYFVSGADPAKGNDVLRALITHEGGEPRIDWEPKLGETEASRRVYTVWGAERADAPADEWIALPPESVPAMRFYRVSVRMTR